MSTATKRPISAKRCDRCTLFFIAAGIIYSVWWMLFASHYETRTNAMCTATWCKSLRRSQAPSWLLPPMKRTP